MAKKSKAKAKYPKSAKRTKKGKQAKKTKQAKKAKKKKKTAGLPPDPCASQQRSFEEAEKKVSDIQDELATPDLPAEQRRKLEQDLKRAQGAVNARKLALRRCRAAHDRPDDH